MRILVTGATGFIGGRLVPKLLAAGHTVRCITRDPAQLRDHFGDTIEIIAGDIFEPAALQAALDGIDIAYYLIHSMSKYSGDFAKRDREAADVFGQACAKAQIQRIIYLGGLGQPHQTHSEHLRSRHEVGDILRACGTSVTEFRAAVVIGSGSASFEMIRDLTERLPVMVAPRWVNTLCQPIWINDVLAYLLETLETSSAGHTIYEIGGSNQLSYLNMMLEYARQRNISRHIFVVPVLTPRLSSYWIHFVTPLPISLARALIDGLSSEVIVHDDRALRDFSIRPVSYATALERTIDRTGSEDPETTWFDAMDVRKLPGEFTGQSQGMLIDRRERQSKARPEALAQAFASLGGKRGWLYGNRLWELRGWLDVLVGGIGMRRGRRSEHHLRVGDAVDFWRVEAYEPDSLLRLRAEMRLPGKAWLQFEAIQDQEGSVLRQSAFFEPKGIFGYIYWYCLVPFHEYIFANMASRIVELAERGSATAGS